MNTAKIYKDIQGNERSIHQMVAHEPQWAASRIQAGEVAIDKLKWAYCELIGSDSIDGLDCCDNYKDWLASLGA